MFCVTKRWIVGNLYRKIEAVLEPAQELVNVLLVAIIAVSAVMLFVRSNSARTAWVTYMLMP